MKAALANAVRPFRRHEYDQMVALGFFQGERVELLEGILAEMSPQSARHATVVSRLHKLLTVQLGDRAEVRAQSPFIASEQSEPEPDVAVLPPGDYTNEHPRRALLIVEVADSSLRTDRLVKLRLYAAAEVDEYWIADLENDLIHVHRRREESSYRQVTQHGRGETVSLVAFPDVQVVVDEIFPLR